MENISLKWYKNSNWIVFFLLIFPPVGILLIWLKSNFILIEKIAITLATFLVLIISFIYPQSTDEMIQNIKLFYKLSISFALIFWGLKLFKIYIRIWGALIGFLFGIIGGYLLEINPIVGGIIASIIGVFISWYIQKAIIFISVGLFFSFISIVFCLYFNINVEIVSFFVFIIAGTIAVILYDYFIIISFALPAALTLFHITFTKELDLSDFYWNERNLLATMVRLFEELGQFYSQYWLSMLFILVLYLLFAIYFQKNIVVKKDDSEDKRIYKLIFKKLSFTFLVILIYSQCFFFSSTGIEVDGKINFTNVIAISSFPIIVYLTTIIFMKMIIQSKINYWKKYLLTLLLGILIIPSISTFSEIIINASRFINYDSDNVDYLMLLLYIPLSGILPWFYNPYVISIVFSLIIFPVILIHLDRQINFYSTINDLQK